MWKIGAFYPGGLAASHQATLWHNLKYCKILLINSAWRTRRKRLCLPFTWCSLYAKFVKCISPSLELKVLNLAGELCEPRKMLVQTTLSVEQRFQVSGQADAHERVHFDILSFSC